MRTMLAALVLASMVPGVLLATYFVLSAHFQRTEAASREVIATARSVAANLDRDLASIEAALQVLSLSPSLAQGNLAAFHQEASHALPFQNLTNYVLIDTQGGQRMNTLRPPDAALPTNTGGAPWQEVFKRDRRVLSDVFMGPLINQPIMAMVVPVHKRDGGPPVYALGAGIVPERIAAVLAAQQLATNWRSIVLDSRGHIIARSHDMPRYVGKLAPPKLVQAVGLHKEGAIAVTTLDGIPTIAGFSRSRTSQWTVAVAIPETELTADLERSLVVLLGTTGVLLAGGVWLAWRLAVRCLVAPAESLQQRMTLIAQGESPHPSLSRHTIDEFVSLEEGFTQMGERLRRREEEREARLVAEASNRAKTDFLSRMSHELRTPLNAVLGFAQVLQMDPIEPLSPRQRGMVDHIESSGQHLLEMISEVLDVSRIESGQLRVHLASVHADDVIAECRQMVQADAKAAQLVLDIDPNASTWTVLADRTRLKQVLINLLSNAIKYNRPGGRVHLSTQAVGDRVRFSVTDTGLGMSPQQLSQLYEPFNRLGREHSGVPGTGIGLVICQRLVALMGGALNVQSTERQGSEFWFELPLVGLRP